MSETIKLWCIKSPRGKFLLDTIEPLKSKTICIAKRYYTRSPENWKTLYRQGYRCVQVEIKEVEK